MLPFLGDRMDYDPETYEKYRSWREWLASLSEEELDKLRKDGFFDDVGFGNATFDDMDITSMQKRRPMRRA